MTANFELEGVHGAKGAQLAADSHTAAIDRIEAIVGAENIECDFERLDGYLARRATFSKRNWLRRSGRG
jgi:hypothetical protein